MMRRRGGWALPLTTGIPTPPIERSCVSPSPPRLPVQGHNGRRYPVPMNALGEIICPGCGRHHHPEGRRIYCSHGCVEWVYNHGGRLDVNEVADRISEIDERLHQEENHARTA